MAIFDEAAECGTKMANAPLYLKIQSILRYIGTIGVFYCSMGSVCSISTIDTVGIVGSIGIIGIYSSLIIRKTEEPYLGGMIHPLS